MKHFHRCIVGLAAWLSWAACHDIAPEHAVPPGAHAQKAVSTRALGHPVPAGRYAYKAVSASALAARKQVADSGRLIVSNNRSFQTAATADELADALDIPRGLIAGTELLGPEAGSAALSNLGVIQPRRGSELVVLSTGPIGTPATAEPGTDFPPGGIEGDVVTLRVDLDLPVDTAKLAFDFNFLSSEAPDFVGSIFNDTFTARVTDANGQREIAFASVNSSFFFDASDTRAGGTGYDLFTLDPEGIDTEFGIGLPDAGITDFQSVNVEVAGGLVSLEFDIHDQGDGIFDSAVILDNLTIELVEIIDPNPDLLTADGQVSTDLAKLAIQGQPITGIAADGATQILLRARVPDLGTATFSLVDGASAPADGGLSALGADDRLSSVTVQAQRIAPGVHYVFALYRAPEDFVQQASHEGLAERPVKFRMNYNAGELEVDRGTRIVRPPVVLIPGLWSACTRWNNTDIKNDARFSFSCASYIGSHADSLEGNAPMVPNAISEALEKLRSDERIAATQADVIGHSMGGILARMHVNDIGNDGSDYRNPFNFNAGDVNRLITMNTPHTGSKIATHTVAYRDAQIIDNPIPPVTDPTHADHFIVELTAAFTAIHLGAIDDLAEGSEALKDFPATVVPAHAIVGTGADGVTFGQANSRLESHKLLWFKLSKENDLNPTIEEPGLGAFSFVFGEDSIVFGNLEHDFFADADSQSGGLTGNAVTTIDAACPSPNCGKSSHFASIRHSPFSARIIELLNAPVASDFFADEFPATPPALLADSGIDFRTRSADVTPSVVIPDGLSIVSPQAGSQVFSGETVAVEVVPQNGFESDDLYLLEPNGVTRFAPGSLVQELEIPATAIGPFSIQVVGFAPGGLVAKTDKIELIATAPATLLAIEIFERDPILFDIGTPRQLTVLGLFDDAVTRDISAAALGTEYASSRPDIVAVSPDGVITAVGPGIATVVARNGQLQTSVSVTVIANRIPIADAGPDQEVICEAPGGAVPVTLDGTGSFDNDGEALTHTWFLNGQVLATGAIADVALDSGTNVVTLVVNDGRDDSKPDEVIIEVSACPGDEVPRPDLALWLLGDSGLTETKDGKVIAWDDQSGNERHATMDIPERRPRHRHNAINDHHVVRFYGAQSLQLASELAPDTFTITLVGRNRRETEGFSVILGPGSENNQLRWENFDEVLLVGTGNNMPVVTSPIGTNYVFHLLTVTYDGTTLSVYRDRQLISTHEFTTSGPWRLGQIGAWFDSYFMIGDLAEILVYDRALGDVERGVVEDYLTEKFALP